ncbi:MAG: CHASE domain-containing protein [Candidatus Saccharibacteria bacterium]|nr:CHASE domain-containing protein [Rhodoferax sp.]
MPTDATRPWKEGEASSERTGRRSVAWIGASIALLAGLSISAVVVRAQRASTAAEARVLFQQHTERLQVDIVKRFDQAVYGLKGANGVFAATHHHVDRDTFRAYVQSRDLPAEFPGVRGFGYAQRVLRPDLEQFVAAEKADNAPEFRVRTAGNAADLFIIKYIEPLAQNYPALGFDLGSDAVRREAVERAIETGLPILSGRIILTRDNVRRYGFIYLVPVFREGSGPTTPAERRTAVTGLLYAPIVATEVLAGAAQQEDDALDFQLSVRSAGNQDEPLFDSTSEIVVGSLGNAPAALNPGTSFREVQQFEIGGRPFTLTATSTPEFDNSVNRLTTWWLGVGGSLISLMMAVTVWLLVAGRARAVAIAEAMTIHLDRLAKVAKGTSNAVIITDTSRRITWVNEGFTRITGYTADEALGRAPGELLQSASTDQVVVQRVREALNAGLGCQVELYNRGKNGLHYWLDMEIQPLHGAAGQLTGFMAIETDISERKTLELKLAEAADALQDLYDHAPCGYYSVDAAGRFLALNNLALHWLGCGLDDVIGQLGPRDFFTDEGRAQFDQNFERFKAGQRIDGMEFDLISRDGTQRRISLSATAVLDAGGQFLRSRSVIFDISETHRIRLQLRGLNVEQEAMLDNDLVGIVKLRNRTAVWKNRALDRLFGYGADELLGQSTSVLYPDVASFEALGAVAYPSLQSGGNFRAQVQMCRKNGELIWIDLSGANLRDTHLHEQESLWMMVDITQIKTYQTQVERAAFHDALTALPNRLLLSDRLRQALAVAAREQHQVAVCYLDLDGFKAINDTHGHEAGDEVLRVVAQRLQSGVRPSDTVARLGGDEFVVALTPVHGRADSLTVLQRLLADIMRPIDLGMGAVVVVGSSIGVALFSADGTTADELLIRADRAMFESKRAGRCGIRFHGGNYVALEGEPPSEAS